MKQLITILLLSFQTLVYAQDIKTSEFTRGIGKYDVSDLWTLERFPIEYGATTVERSGPLGYIGDNYQRFYIHFISAIQNPQNPLEYFIYGKTRVKENICSFQGTIVITQSRTYDEGDIPELKQGVVMGVYEFYEDPDQKGTGILKGKFQSDFYIDKDNKIKYDAIAFVADGFQNNQFEGTWTGYRSSNPKKCNWGDYRIPDSEDFDMGAGEFSPDDKYLKNGWENYSLAWGYPPERADVKEAMQKEKARWWAE